MKGQRMSEGNGYSKTQLAMLEVLADGMAHTREELHAVCGPSSLNVVKTHVARLRKHLRLQGQDIICELAKRRVCYRHVRLLANPYTGYN